MNQTSTRMVPFPILNLKTLLKTVQNWFSKLKYKIFVLVKILATTTKLFKITITLQYSRWTKLTDWLTQMSKFVHIILWPWRCVSRINIKILKMPWKYKLFMCSFLNTSSLNIKFSDSSIFCSLIKATQYSLQSSGSDRYRWESSSNDLYICMHLKIPPTNQRNTLYLFYEWCDPSILVVT